jgi:UDP-N-acetylglucosamine 2-epimerase (non-hydrolysing)
MPEEINRKAADVSSKLYFVPTEESAINLISEDISRKRVFITGNTVVDACYRNLQIAENRDISEYEKELADLDIDNMDNILTLTMHRAENVDVKQRLNSIIDALIELKDMNIIFPIHPRTRKTLENFGLLEKLNKYDHIHIIKPVGYLDFLVLLSKSTLILTDSGGLQEEAITLNIPALTLRYNTERPETVSAGGNILVGSDKDVILDNASKILNNPDFANKMKNAKNPYGKGNTANEILTCIEKFYKNNKLALVSPDKVMSTFNREMKLITEDVTVKEFEDKYNALIQFVFSENAIFPSDDLNIKNKFILYKIYS